MIVDPSALVAILTREPGRHVFVDALVGCDHVTLSAPSYVELASVTDGRGLPFLRETLDELLAEQGVTIRPFEHRHAVAARRAYQRFGKGSGHRARLNFGDCLSYAMAVVEDEPLLFKGDDFTHTDARNALAELEGEPRA